MKEPWLCKHGHDKNVVGVSSNRGCRVCKRRTDRAYNIRRRERRDLSNPICCHGHDKRVVGFSWDGGCAKCHRIRNNKYDHKRRLAAAKENPRSDMLAQSIPNLRAVRRELGISGKEMAELTGIHETAIYKMERGEQKARPYQLRKILPLIAERMAHKKLDDVA